MKSIVNFLAFGALLAINGAMAAPVPEPVKVVTTTLYYTKVYAVTSTKWVEPTQLPKEGGPKKDNGEEKVTTTSSTSEYSSTTSSETTSETPTAEAPTSTTTSSTPTSTSTSTTEETTPTPTPIPTPTEEETTISIPPTTIEVPTTTQPKPEPTNIQPPPKEVEEENDGGSGGISFSGEATYYDPGMGSCGISSSASEFIAAISYIVMDRTNPGNPNNNPLCGKQLKCSRDGKNPTIVTIVDRCPGCDEGDVDLSPAAYESLGGTIAEGRFPIQCEYI